MKNWKEKASELSQWELKGVPVVYPIAFIILLLPILFWNFNNIRYFDGFEIAPDSARYLLSALVQSLAAIIAIVVTLTLVAVQLAASAYSPRVIDIFKKDRVMWLLLVWYGLSIFFGLFVLEMIGGKYQSLGHWGVSLESCVFLAYLMGIAAFAGLFLHLINVFKLLNPTNLTMELLKDLIKDKNKTTDRILKSVESARDQKLDPKQHPEDDPLQPIVAIIRGSLAKYDFETTRAGLNAIVGGMIEIIRPFSIDTGLKEDLISGKSSKKLKSAFKNNRHSLPESLVVYYFMSDNLNSKNQPNSEARLGDTLL